MMITIQSSINLVSIYMIYDIFTKSILHLAHIENLVHDGKHEIMGSIILYKLLFLFKIIR